MYDRDATWKCSGGVCASLDVTSPCTAARGRSHELRRMLMAGMYDRVATWKCFGGVCASLDVTSPCTAARGRSHELRKMLMAGMYDRVATWKCFAGVRASLDVTSPCSATRGRSHEPRRVFMARISSFAAAKWLHLMLKKDDLLNSWDILRGGGGPGRASCFSGATFCVIASVLLNSAAAHRTGE
ncbi:hypothetical protein PUN28_017525 [Cardiocondyla obscurior]|uniref:Uncharacterized protein n=1 Tax=Cardiocondyla obscurior TaxID=286306 RepID=A0AAW2EHT3_9HYME